MSIWQTSWSHCTLFVHTGFHDSESQDQQSQLVHSMGRGQCLTRSCYYLMTSLKDMPTEHSSTNWWPKSLPSAPLPHESLTNTREVSASWQRNWNNAHLKTRHNLMLPNATMCLEQPWPRRSPSMELWQVSLHAERKRSRVTLLIHDQNKTDPSTEITWSRLHIFREDTYVHIHSRTHTHTLMRTKAWLKCSGDMELHHTL